MSETKRFARGSQSDDGLKLSSDRKVSPRGWLQESNNRWVPLVPNGFGLLAGESCPGKTSFCESCYAVKSEQGQGVEELVTHNLEMLRDAETVENMTDLLVDIIQVYDAEARRRCISDRERIFRIHWDGDFFSVDYAQAWANAMAEFPEVRFWAYTRSFVEPVDVVPILYSVDNLALYLSVDAENVDAAHEVVEDYPSVLLAYCSEVYDEGFEMARGRKAIICPENIGRISLMDKGKGACVACLICPDARADVLFSTTHKHSVPKQLEFFVEDTPVFIQKRRVKPSHD